MSRILSWFFIYFQCTWMLHVSSYRLNNYFFEFQKRLILVSLHVFGPYAVGRFLDWVEKKFKSGDWDSVPQETREFILKSLPVLQQALSLLQRFHLALFYLRGVFYHIAKRLTNVSYVSKDKHCWLFFRYKWHVLLNILKYGVIRQA